MSIEIRPFTNPVMLFPKKILQEVNDLIDNGFKQKRIHQYLTQAYGSKLKIPHYVTISYYVKHYNEVLKKPKEDLKEMLQKDINTLSGAVDAVESGRAGILKKNKEQVLESLIEKCNDRMERLETFLSRSDQSDLGAKYESILLKYITELRSIIETLAKLSGELKEEQSLIINVVKQETSLIFQLFNDVIREMVPDKFDVIKDKLDEKIKYIYNQKI